MQKLPLFSCISLRNEGKNPDQDYLYMLAKEWDLVFFLHHSVTSKRNLLYPCPAN